MKKYEVMVERYLPCNGGERSGQEFLEIETADPLSYVKTHGRYPVLDSGHNPLGDVIITTGDGKGNMERYIFTE